ncbi:MAG TPA: hypothetical protein VGN17_01950 [Bryobacteraceae bacterium]
MHKKQTDLRLVCGFCGTSVPLVGEPRCFPGARQKYGPCTDAQSRLATVVTGKGPIPCILNLAQSAGEISLKEYLSQRIPLSSVIDDLGDVRDLMKSSPWTRSKLLWIPAVLASLLSRHMELRSEQGPALRTDIRHELQGLDQTQVNAPMDDAAMGDKALLEAGRGLLDLADGNPLGANEFTANAAKTAAISKTSQIYKLCLLARAKAFDEIGDTAMAGAFRGMAGRVTVSEPYPIWLELTLWNLNDDAANEEELAA